MLKVSLNEEQHKELKAIILDPELSCRASRKIVNEWFIRTFNITQAILDIVYIGNGSFTIKVN